MKVIVATWIDSYNQPYMTDLYDSDMFESEILDYFREAKEMYGHHVLNRTNDALVFTDGTRVRLTIQHVKASVLEDDFAQDRIMQTEVLRLAE